jgi:hypothetical protein
VYVKPSIRSHRVSKAAVLHGKDGTLPVPNSSPLFLSRYRSVLDRLQRSPSENTRPKKHPFKTSACARRARHG